MADLLSLQDTRLGHRVYNAGLPQFPRNFSRDSLLAGLLLQDPPMLLEQIELCMELQGKTENFCTGEEEGKIHHEFPAAELRGRSTLYNACDTTTIFCIAAEAYWRWTGDEEFRVRVGPAVKRSVSYILRHVRGYLFWEGPSWCGADRFALKVTYWKDSQLPAERQEPRYPVVYTLAHLQNAQGLRSAAALLGQESLTALSFSMRKEGVRRLWDWETGFLVAVDQIGPIPGPSSDTLHALAYLEPGDLGASHKRVVEKVAAVLETEVGYRASSPEATSRMEDKYHSGAVVWVFEQAFIREGARKFDLPHIAEVATRVLPYLDTAPELLGPAGEKLGCDPQLWSVAAREYLKR